MPAKGVLAPEPAFHKRARPVEVEVERDGTFRSNGIDFSDFARMQTSRHKQSGERRLPTPSWALRPSEFQQLLARFMEVRAQIRYPRIDTPKNRIRFAERKLLQLIPKKFETIDRLSAEYITLKNSGGDAKRLRKLENEVENLDTTILLARRGAAVIAAIVYLYHRVGLDSVGVGTELHAKPPLIRQTLYRLSRLWQKMQDGADAKPTPEEVRRAAIREEYRKNPEASRERSRQRRASMTPSEREAFRKYHHEYNVKNREPVRQRAREWKRRKASRSRWPSFRSEVVGDDQQPDLQRASLQGPVPQAMGKK